GHLLSKHPPHPALPPLSLHAALPIWPGGHTNLPDAASYLSSTSGMRMVERTVMCAGSVTSTIRSRPAGQAKISSFVSRSVAFGVVWGTNAAVCAAPSDPPLYGGT